MADQPRRELFNTELAVAAVTSTTAVLQGRRARDLTVQQAMQLVRPIDYSSQQRFLLVTDLCA